MGQLRLPRSVIAMRGGMVKMIVFVVQHASAPADGREDVKMIGVYTSQEFAEAAVGRLRARPGFCETPHGFSVDRYELDADHWTDGFVS